MTTTLSVLAFLLALGALTVSLQARRAASGRTAATGASDLPHDALGLRHEVAALRAEADRALRNLAVVRYDAFGAGPDRSSGTTMSHSPEIVHV